MKKMKWTAITPIILLALHTAAITRPITAIPFMLFELLAGIPLYGIAYFRGISEYSEALSRGLECTFAQKMNGACMGVTHPPFVIAKAAGVVWIIYGILIGRLIDKKVAGAHIAAGQPLC